jgi:hypothetical protein
VVTPAIPIDIVVYGSCVIEFIGRGYDEVATP